MASAETQVRIDAAIDRFRSRMLAANRAYLRDVAREIQALNLPPAASLQRLGKSVHHMDSLWLGEQNSVAAVADADFPEFYCMDGVFPPKTEAEQAEYLEWLRAGVRTGQADIDIPEDYLALIKRTDYLHDPDLHEHQIPGVHGTNCWKRQPYFEGCSMSPAQIRANGMFGVHGWEVSTGWAIDGNEKMMSFYIYCRRTQPGRGPPVQSAEQEWQWRIYLEKEDEDGGLAIFPTLEEYMDFLSGWYERDPQRAQRWATQRVQKPRFIEGVDEYDEDADEDDEDEDDDF